MSASTFETAPQAYARTAALLILISLIAGSFGEFYVPQRLIHLQDAQATATDVQTYAGLFRLGFASYMVEALCDVGLALLYYALLRPVNRDLSLLTAFFGLVSTTLFAVAELGSWVGFRLLTGPGLPSLPADQVQPLAMLAFKVSGWCGGIFMPFFGVPTLLRGWMIFRSGYLPRVPGLLVALGGLSFLIKGFTLLLAPSLSSDLLLLPMILGMLALAVGLLAKGVDEGALAQRLGKVP